MSDTSQGHGWWQASDGRWYPPEAHPNYRAQPFQPPTLPQVQVAPPQPSQPIAYPAYPAAMTATTKPRKSRKRWWILGAGAAIVALVAISAASPNTDDTSAASPQAAADGAVVEAPSGAEPTGPIATDPPPPPEPQFTASQENSIRAAENYLEFMAFSRQGLIDQLSSEYGSQFPVADATFAVDILNVDWNEQAAKSAQNYLDTMPFSCQGLIDQLSSGYGSQFTIEQAQHGAAAAGVC